MQYHGQRLKSYYDRGHATEFKSQDLLNNKY